MRRSSSSKRTLQTDPNFGAAHYWLAYSYLEKGMSDKAIREIETWLSVTGRNSDLSSDLGYFKARSGKQKEARTILNNLLRLSIKSKAPGGSSVDPTDLSRIYAALGNKSEAYEWTERAFEQHSVSIVWIKVHPSADSLRSDDRFVQLLRRMKLAEEPRS